MSGSAGTFSILINQTETSGGGVSLQATGRFDSAAGERGRLTRPWG
jgi:hypothetical protein